MRRAMAVLTVVGAGLAWLTGGQAVTRATAPPSEPATTVASKEQAAAEAALLVLADFPAGWTEEADDALTDEELAYQAEVAACADGTGDNLLDLGGPRAKTPDFVGPDNQRVEQSVTIVDVAVAEDLMARFVAPGVDACFLDSVVEFTAEQYGSTDPSQSTPEGVTVGDVTIEPLRLAPAGDELAGYRITLALTVSGATVDAFVDVVIVRSGGSVAGFTFQSIFDPFPPAEIEHYIDLAIERLPG